MSRNRRENSNDDNGVSILQSRLKGEVLEDKVIEELLVNNDDKKQEQKKDVKPVKEPKPNKASEPKGNVFEDNVSENCNSDNNKSIINKDNEKVAQKVNNLLDGFEELEPEEVEEEPKPQTFFPKPQPTPQASVVVPTQTVAYQTQTPVHNFTPQVIQTPIQPQQAIPWNAQQVMPIQPQIIPIYPQQVVANPYVMEGQKPHPVGQVYGSNDNNNNTKVKDEVKVDKQMISAYKNRYKKSTTSKVVKKIISWAIYIAVIVTFIILMKTYVVGITKMDGDSMNPTYTDDETLIIDKISVKFKAPELNDCIIYEKDGVEYISRIVAAPHSTIQINEDGYLMINGKRKDTSEEATVYEAKGIATEEIELEGNEFFVINDDTDNDTDSRTLGVIKRDEIKGVILFNLSFN